MPGLLADISISVRFSSFLFWGNLFGLFHKSRNPAAFRGPRTLHRQTYALRTAVVLTPTGISPSPNHSMHLQTATCLQLPLTSAPAHVHTNHTPFRCRRRGLNMHVLLPNHRLFPKSSVRGTAQLTMMVMMCCWVSSTARRTLTDAQVAPNAGVINFILFTGQILQLER